MIDRAKLCGLLSSAINYANVGKQAEADAKARELVTALGCEGILASPRDAMSMQAAVLCPHESLEDWCAICTPLTPRGWGRV